MMLCIGSKVVWACEYAFLWNCRSYWENSRHWVCGWEYPGTVRPSHSPSHMWLM